MAKKDSGAPAAPGLKARLAGVAMLLTGDVPDWFGPLQPLSPQAPAEVAGRRFDYQGGINLVTQPRAPEPISFRQLRGMARDYDLLRLAIETRKDQLSKLEWAIKPKDKKSTGADPRIQQLTEFFAFPDQENNWSAWLRMLVEDMLVIDAPAIYVRPNLGGGVYALELIDGATIKRVLDEGGRTPQPPQPAYQQILKGLPAVDYTTAELIYVPRNLTTDRIYGYSPVEQVVMTVEVALRRQRHQLQYYTEGNVPEALIGVPETWTPDQISQFQDYWDALLAGDTAHRRHAKFVPGQIAKGYVPTKEAALKDEYDEWLARMICYAFSLSPQAFVKQMNRSTAENAQEQALQEGLAPLMEWVKSVIDRVLWRVMDCWDLEFSWVEEQEQDPLTQAQVNQIYLTAGVFTRNQVLDTLGMPPVKGGEVNLIQTTTGLVRLEDAVKPPEPPAPAPPQFGHNGGPPMGEDENAEENADKDKGETRSKTFEKLLKIAVIPAKPVDHDRPACRHAEAELLSIWSKILGDERQRIVSALRDRLAKADGDETPASPADIATVGQMLDAMAYDQALTQTCTVITDLAKDGIGAGFVSLGIDLSDATHLANPRAVAWAQDHAAELVKGVSDTTKGALNSLIVKAEDEGWSVQRLASEIESSYAFSAERSQLIAHMEMRNADAAGNLIAWKAAKSTLGLKVRKRWIERGNNVCDACLENVRAGAIDIDEEFPSGDEVSPAHPHCECDTQAEREKNDAEGGGGG